MNIFPSDIFKPAEELIKEWEASWDEDKKENDTEDKYQKACFLGRLSAIYDMLLYYSQTGKLKAFPPFKIVKNEPAK